MECTDQKVTGRGGLHTADVVHEGSRPGDVRASQADNRVLKSLFPSVEPVPLRDGLTETLAWFKERS